VEWPHLRRIIEPFRAYYGFFLFPFSAFLYRLLLFSTPPPKDILGKWGWALLGTTIGKPLISGFLGGDFINFRPKKALEILNFD